MIRYEYNRPLGILEVTYEGKINVEQLADYGIRISNDETIPRELKLITDASKAEYEISVNDMPKVLEALVNHVKNFVYIKAAFIQTKPKETALSLIFEKAYDLSNYHHKIFATKDAAIEWLLQQDI